MSKEIKDIGYIEIFKKSFDITWKNKILWWFGLFLVVGGGMNNLNYAFDRKEKYSKEEISHFVSSHWELAVAGVIILAVISIAIIILSVIARGGTIESIEKVLKDQPIAFRSGMTEGKKYFWKILLLYIRLIFIMIASLIVLATPVVLLFLAKTYILGAILAFLAILIFIPLIVLISYLKTYGEIYIVSGKLSAWNAIETSYELLRKNLAASLIMGILFVPIGILLMLGMMIAIAPLALLTFVFAFLGKIGIAIAIILGIIIFSIIITLQSVFQVFHQTAWLLFFHEIAAPKEEEKVTEAIGEIEKEILPSASDAVKTVEIEK